MRPRVLRIFARYQRFGGEEAVAKRIHADLEDYLEADWFEYSTDDLLGKSWGQRIQAPLKVVHNAPAANHLRALQRERRYQAFEIHNVLPALSPGIYKAAFELGVPVVHFLHNYRLSCVNGFFLNHGQPCHRCIRGNFLPAVLTRCWRESRVACGTMGITLQRVRWLKTFSKVDAWVALSEVQKRLHLKMGLPEGKLHVLPHYLEPTPNFQTAVPDDGYALFLGRLSPEKGVIQLIRAWAGIPTSAGRLVIAGTGPLEGECRALVNALNLPNVSFTGFVPPSEQGALWAGAKFAVIPSVWDEPFPLVVLEAWANGRGLVVSDWGSLPETGKGASLVARVEDTDGFACALERALQERKLAATLAEQGKRKLRREFGRDLWLRRVAGIYASAGVPFTQRVHR
ncbi:MAG: glycosyltransferase family 4 protein [Verrucomicrobia bacterium]|nr:glycosyltransferase family 4 protein [Verrucomicrobiota bacterium]